MNKYKRCGRSFSAAQKSVFQQQQEEKKKEKRKEPIRNRGCQLCSFSNRLLSFFWDRDISIICAFSISKKVAYHTAVQIASLTKFIFFLLQLSLVFLVSICSLVFLASLFLLSLWL